MPDQKYIRNFSIIAHIDHGKSTLADRLLEYTDTVPLRERREQMLDSMDLERERGITIKSQVATLKYQGGDKQTYFLNLIDTPGHVDFSYEVSRALAACEGVLLVVDASQGVEAQTVANMYQAMEHDLVIIPVINKIDLPAADIENTKAEIENELGLDPSTAVCISAKEGINIDEVFQAIIKHIPPPNGDQHAPFQGLIFDAQYDQYRGVVVSICIKQGAIRKDQDIKFFQSGAIYRVDEVGIYQIKFVKKTELQAGDVGYLIANIRDLQDAKIGDTITTVEHPAAKPLPGYKDVKPMVFSGFYPVDGEDYGLLQDALGKLKLNDASLVYEPEKSAALGFGFRCGFLGLLHLEIISERLEREYDLSIISTAPSVEYHFILTKGEEVIIDNPANFPEPNHIEYAREPFVRVGIITPAEFLGNVMNLAMDKRGEQVHMNYLDEKRIQIDYDMPLAEIIYDFHDRLKSISRGYASYDYYVLEYRDSDLVKVDVMVNERKVDAFSQIVHRDKAVSRGRFIIERLKEIIPRHMFRIPLQAAIGGSIIARENISALRKNVTAKCYGGDITRKRKLLEKQKEGKKRMRQFGNVDIPREAFVEVLKNE